MADRQFGADTQIQAALQTSDPDDIMDMVRTFETGEFNQQYGLGVINAQWAYARGATGDGVTIGVIDTQLVTHPEIPASRVDASSSRGNVNFRGFSHGTATTGIALASRNGQGVHGVAYDASVRFRSVGLGSGDGTFEPISLADLASLARTITGWLQPFVNDGIPVVNLSLGVQGLIIDSLYNPLYDRPNLSASVADFIALMAQTELDDTDADRTIFVWAASNSNGDSCSASPSAHGCINGEIHAYVPDLTAGLPYIFSELRGHTLAVAAINEDNDATPNVNEGTIARFSNRCGTLPSNWSVQNDGRHYCLSAPGNNIDVIQSGGGHDLGGGGTSYAAPHVAGAIAVLIDFFTDVDKNQNVGNTAIVFRMLETANRRGIYAADCADPTTGSVATNDLECPTYSTTYGAGLLDLKAATEPMGMTSIATGSTLTGPALPFAGTRLSAGPAYGDAFTRAFANTRVAAFDSMLFPFWHPLTSLVDAPPRRTIHHHRARFSPARRVAADLPGIGTLRLGVETLSPAPRRSFRPDADVPPRRRPSSLAFSRETGDGAVFASWRAPDATPFALRESLPTPLSGDAFDHPFLAFAGDGITAGLRVGPLTAAAFTDPDALSPVHGMALDYALSPYLSAQAGMLNEKGGALGLRPDGAFGGLGVTTTAFTGLKLDAPVSPRWRALAHAHLGTARPDVGGVGLVKGVSSMLASAFSVGFAGYGVFTGDDSLTLALSQPLRVERGRVSLVVPTGRTPDGDLRRAAVDAGLEPSGREVAVSAAWTAPLSRAAVLRLAAGAARHPGHDGAAGNAFHALADVSFRF